MLQLDLFAAPLARSSDPATSQIAAEEVQPKLGRLEALFVEVLESLGEATAAEVGREAHERYGVNSESIRKRASRLVYPLHEIFAIGERRCSTTNKLATVYRIVDQPPCTH